MYSRVIACLFLISIIASSCSKTNPDANQVPGKDGFESITAYPTDNGWWLTSAGKVYIKYNAQSAPTNGVYDDSSFTTIEAGHSAATFNGLGLGNYYLHVSGTYNGVPVSGGTPFTIQFQTKPQFVQINMH